MKTGIKCHSCLVRNVTLHKDTENTMDRICEQQENVKEHMSEKGYLNQKAAAGIYNEERVLGEYDIHKTNLRQEEQRVNSE